MPMHYCVATGCTNHSATKGIQFHSFPIKRPEMLRKWLDAMKQGNWQPKKKSRLCNEHFLKSDYRCLPSSYCALKQLKSDAVPSVFSFYSKLQKKSDGKESTEVKNDEKVEEKIEMETEQNEKKEANDSGCQHKSSKDHCKDDFLKIQKVIKMEIDSNDVDDDTTYDLRRDNRVEREIKMEADFPKIIMNGEIEECQPCNITFVNSDEIQEQRNKEEFNSSVGVSDPLAFNVGEPMTFRCSLCPFITTIKDSWWDHRRVKHKKRTTCENDVVKGEMRPENPNSQTENKQDDAGESNLIEEVITEDRIIKHIKEKTLKELLLSGNHREGVEVINEDMLGENTDTRFKVVKHGRIRRLECATCGQMFQKKHVFESHYLRHSGVFPYGCTLCEFKTRQKCSLKRHMMLRHEMKIDYKDIPRTDGKTKKTKIMVDSTMQPNQHYKVVLCGNKRYYKCTICQKVCQGRVIFETHFLVHTGEKPYACTICEFKSSQKSRLNSHLRVKHGVKENHIDGQTVGGEGTCKGKNVIQCKRCNKAILKWNFKKHVLTHKKVRTFLCSICGYKCKSQTTLIEHMKVNHSEVFASNEVKEAVDKKFRYVCKLCHRSFLYKSRFGKHMTVHLNLRLYKCSFCKYRSNTKYTLRIHMKTKHDTEVGYHEIRENYDVDTEDSDEDDAMNDSNEDEEQIKMEIGSDERTKGLSEKGIKSKGKLDDWPCLSSEQIQMPFLKEECEPEIPQITPAKDELPMDDGI